MEGRELVVNQLSPKISQGIAPTLILIRVRLGVSKYAERTDSEWASIVSQIEARQWGSRLRG